MIYDSFQVQNGCHRLHAFTALGQVQLLKCLTSFSNEWWTAGLFHRQPSSANKNAVSFHLYVEEWWGRDVECQFRLVVGLPTAMLH